MGSGMTCTSSSSQFLSCKSRAVNLKTGPFAVFALAFAVRICRKASMSAWIPAEFNLAWVSLSRNVSVPYVAAVNFVIAKVVYYPVISRASVNPVITTVSRDPIITCETVDDVIFSGAFQSVIVFLNGNLSIPTELLETKKAGLPKETLTLVTHGSPAFLDTGPATFRPHLTMGLAIYVVF
jgi:hypothetical protein